jgi:hypothetical protein
MATNSVNSGNSHNFGIMTTTYHLNVNELSVELINSIKAAFKDKTVDITVSESIDETDYLLSSEANKKMLEESIQQLKDGKGISFSIEEFQKKYGA